VATRAAEANPENTGPHLRLAAAASRRRRLVSALEVRVAMSDFVSESSIAALDRSRSKLNDKTSRERES
jgi:hypothetical protein